MPSAAYTDITEMPESTKTPRLHNVGRRLKKERLAKKFGLEDVSATLKVRKTYIKAIENNDFDSLPEETYSAGFVRSYALLVDLDPNQISDEFKEDYQRTKTPASEEPALQVIVTTKTPSSSVLVVSIVVLACLIFGWMISRNEAVQETALSMASKLTALVTQSGQPAADSTEEMAPDATSSPALEVSAPADFSPQETLDIIVPSEMPTTPPPLTRLERKQTPSYLHKRKHLLKRSFLKHLPRPRFPLANELPFRMIHPEEKQPPTL
jgi:cytoskeletal protein RodZ